MRSFPWILGALLAACAIEHTSELTPPEADAPTRRPPRDAQPDGPDPAALGTDAAPLDAGVQEPPRPSVAPDASGEPPKEVCNGQDDDGDGKLDEGCVMQLALDDDNRPNEIYDTPVQLDGARLIWGHTDADYQGNLWTVKLPLGRPELLFTHAPPVRASHDGERVVYSDYDQFGFTLLDLRDGTRRLIKPIEPDGYNLMYTSLEGRYLAYSQDMKRAEDEAVFLHDLETGQTQPVEPHPSLQWRPRISQGQLIWLDDRYGHHTDQWGLDHRYDVMAVALPYVPGTMRQLTQAPPRSMRVFAFEGGRVLMESTPSYEAPPLQDLQTIALRDVAGGYDLPLRSWLPLGDLPLDLSATRMLVRREPLGRCHLDVVELASGRSTELDLQGECPSGALIDGDYVVWTRTLGTTTDVFWMDIGDLDAAR